MKIKSIIPNFILVLMVAAFIFYVQITHLDTFASQGALIVFWVLLYVVQGFYKMAIDPNTKYDSKTKSVCYFALALLSLLEFRRGLVDNNNVVYLLTVGICSIEGFTNLFDWLDKMGSIKKKVTLFIVSLFILFLLVIFIGTLPITPGS